MIGLILQGASANTYVKPNRRKTEVLSEKKPVTPVARTAAVQRERINEIQIPTREGADPQEALVRSRITPYEERQQLNQVETKEENLTEKEEATITKEAVIACEYCQHRKSSNAASEDQRIQVCPECGTRYVAVGVTTAEVKVEKREKYTISEKSVDKMMTIVAS
ncbi:MAG: hypothetical protein R3Y63_00260 [Eubacteriales bacterium]